MAGDIAGLEGIWISLSASHLLFNKEMWGVGEAQGNERVSEHWGGMKIIEHLSALWKKCSYQGWAESWFLGWIIGELGMLIPPWTSSGLGCWGRRNLILEQSVDRNKCIVGFKSFGVLGSNLGLSLQAAGVGLWTCHLTFGSLHFFIYTLRIILSGLVRIKGATKKLFTQGLIHIREE